MAQVPDGYQTLRTDSVADILEELLEAQNQSYVLGLKLKLPLADVDAIHENYSSPRDRLLHVIIAFLKQTYPKPTWDAIVDALDSRVVNLPAVARRVRKNRFSQVRYVTSPNRVFVPIATSGTSRLPRAASQGTLLEPASPGVSIIHASISDLRLLERRHFSYPGDGNIIISPTEPARPRYSETDHPYQPPSPRPAEVPQSIPQLMRPRTKRVQHGMTNGSATATSELAYFTQWCSKYLYSYKWSTQKWSKLVRCPCRNSGLVIINGELTAVGGESTNKLFTLRRRKWVEEYPPMNTTHSNAAVVSTSDGEYIIVIGGYVGGGWTATVELFQVSSRRWCTLRNLPHSLHCPSATICGARLYVIGRDSGYLCSLQALLSNDRPITSQSIPDLISWTPFTPLPVTYSTAATLSGQLVIIGGLRGGSLVNAIHQLIGRQWVKIGSMSRDRMLCLVVSPSPDKMVIVGGGVGTEDTIEEFIV